MERRLWTTHSLRPIVPLARRPVWSAVYMPPKGWACALPWKAFHHWELGSGGMSLGQHAAGALRVFAKWILGDAWFLPVGSRNVPRPTAMWLSFPSGCSLQPDVGRAVSSILGHFRSDMLKIWPSQLSG